MYVEMPILDITLNRPLPMALTKFLTAFSGDRSPDRPVAMSASVSIARYGWTASAP
ncbi:hypothetical protein D3C87_1239170 [compost metagenome]